MELLNTIKMKIPSCKENSDLLLIKLLLFTYYGGTACVFPYLAVHMRQIGITVQETAVIHAMLPVAMFVGPPVAGFIADKFGGHKLLLIISLLFTSFFHTSLLWVPQTKRGADLSDGLSSMTCTDLIQSDDQSASTTTVMTMSFRVPLPDCSSTIPVNVTFVNCVQRCHRNTAYSLIENSDINDTDNHITSLCGHHGEFCIGYDKRSGDYEFLQTQIQIEMNSTSDPSGRRVVELPPRWLRFHPANSLSVIDKTCSNLLGGVSGVQVENTTESLVKPEVKPICLLTCSKLSDDNASLLWTSECGSSSRTFWIYLMLRVAASIFMSCCFCLFDATTLFIVARHNTDYGRQRIYPVLATAIFPPITGVLVDYFSALDGVKGVINYNAPFYMLDGLLVCTAVMLALGGLDIRAGGTEDTNLRGVGRLLKNPRVDVLIFSLFLLGTLWGYVEVFLYWFLMELGSPTYLLGLTLTVGSGIGIPVLFFSDKIIKRLGNVTIVGAAFIFYAIRYIGYSVIYNPWLSLIFEAMEIFTVHLMWVSVVTYTSQIVPKGLQATMQGVMGGTHYGFGRGSGSLIGGLLMGYIGARSTFRYMGFAAAIIGIIYVLVEKVALRGVPILISESNDETKPDIKDEQIMKNGSSGTKKDIPEIRNELTV